MVIYIYIVDVVVVSFYISTFFSIDSATIIHIAHSFIYSVFNI